jgi:hypothetical protein
VATVLVSAVTSFCFRSDLTCMNSAILLKKTWIKEKQQEEEEGGG